MPRCPGQDMRYWKPEDIFDLECPGCSNKIEFWKDEPMRFCPQCKLEVRNPRIDLGCAKWCKYGKECLGSLPELDFTASPVLLRLMNSMKKPFISDKDFLKQLDRAMEFAEAQITPQAGEPSIIIPSVLILVAENIKPAESGIHEKYFDMLIDSGLETPVCESILSVVIAIITDDHSGLKELKELKASLDIFNAIKTGRED